jgi:hypothetical protein
LISAENLLQETLGVTLKTKHKNNEKNHEILEII